MRIFTRYILKEVLSHGLIGVAVFTFVIFMRDVGQLLELLVRNSAPIPSVAEFSFLLLPKAMTVTIPMGVLVGILIGLSRMSADSEITAMRASGVGVQRFVWIIALFGFTAWMLAMGNSILVAPRSAAALARLQNNLASTLASANVQPRVFYEDFKNTVIYVQDVKSDPEGGEIWRNVFQADISTPGSPKITIAQEALVSTSEKDAIRLHLVNGEEHLADVKTSDQYSISTFQETDIRLNLPAIPKPAQEAIPVAQLGTRDLLGQTYHPNKEFARWYWIEFNRRLALPTACLVLVLIGGLEGVRHVERRTADLNVQVQRVHIVRVAVDAIEERKIVAGVVDGLELRRIQVAIGSQPADREEISDPVRARADVSLEGRSVERSVAE